MKPALLAAITELYNEYKILKDGYTDFLGLSNQQDTVIDKVRTLFDVRTPPSEDEEPEEVVTNVFALINVRSGETLAIAELPENKAEKMGLLKDVISETMSLDVQYGGDYTLVPMFDPAQKMFIALYAAYKHLMKGCSCLGDLSTSRDRVCKYVEFLFGTHERVLLPNKEEIAKYIAWLRKHANNYQPTTVDRAILCDFQPLLDDLAAAAAAGETEEEEETLEVSV